MAEHLGFRRHSAERLSQLDAAPELSVCYESAPLPPPGAVERMSEEVRPLEIDTRLESLRATHRGLDERIAQLISDGHQDQVELQRLKKQKLALKDRIAHLESDRIPDIIA